MMFITGYNLDIPWLFRSNVGITHDVYNWGYPMNQWLYRHFFSALAMGCPLGPTWRCGETNDPYVDHLRWDATRDHDSNTDIDSDYLSLFV